MIITHSAQYVRMFKIVSEYSRLHSMEIFGYVPNIEWPYDIQTSKHPPDRTWLRVSRQVVIDRQASHKNVARRFTTEGLLFVQLFLTRTDPLSGARGSLWASGLKSAFRSNSSDADTIYRNTRVEEARTEAEWFRLNLVSEFEFDEFE